MTRLALRIMLRHRGRMLFFASCIAIGIGFLFAIGNILDTLQSSIAGRARQMMAADVTLSSARAFSPRVEKALKALHKERYRSTRMLQFVSMLRPGEKGAPLLVSVKAIEQSYPFYGTFTTTPARGPKAFAKEPICYVAPELLMRRKLKVGDKVRLGKLWFRIAGVIKNEPDRMVAFSGLAPRVIIPLSMAKKTGLINFGSRINYKILLAAPLDAKGAEATIAKKLRARLDKAVSSPYIRVRSYTQAQPSIQEATRRSASFFLLASLVALILGAIGMAASVTAFLNEQIETVGILRSLGLGPKDISWLYLQMCVGMGLLGGLGGVLFGVALSGLGLQVIQSVLGVSLPIQIHAANLLEGFILALVLAVGLNYAAIRALAALRPLDILAGRVHRIALSRLNLGITGLLLLVGVALFVFKGSRSILVTGFFTASMIGSLLVCLLLILLALAILGGFSGQLSGSQGWLFVFRHGLRQLLRQRTRTLTFLLALSIGTTLLSTLRLLEHSLVTEIQSGIGKRAPDMFLIDIQSDQLDGLLQMMKKYTKKKPRYSPLIRARLTHINEKLITPKDTKSFRSMTMEARSRARFLAREYNLTYKDKLNTSETVLQGAFWKPGTTAKEVSLEQRFAQRVGVKLGDTMTFNILGRSLKAKVTSIRKINWMSMMPNFFVIFPKKVLEQAPKIFISSALFGDAKQITTFQTELIAKYPNISSINLGPIVTQVRTTMRYFVGALRGLAWVCVLVGLLILAGTLNMGRTERRNKVALMRTLGLKRNTLLAIDCLELLLIGLLTAAIAIGVSSALGAIFTSFMNIRFTLSWVLLLEVGLAATALPVVVGLLINRSIYQTGVMDNLRQAG